MILSLLALLSVCVNGSDGFVPSASLVLLKPWLGGCETNPFLIFSTEMRTLKSFGEVSFENDSLFFRGDLGPDTDEAGKNMVESLLDLLSRACAEYQAKKPLVFVTWNQKCMHALSEPLTASLARVLSDVYDPATHDFQYHIDDTSDAIQLSPIDSKLLDSKAEALHTVSEFDDERCSRLHALLKERQSNGLDYSLRPDFGPVFPNIESKLDPSQGIIRDDEHPSPELFKRLGKYYAKRALETDPERLKRYQRLKFIYVVSVLAGVLVLLAVVIISCRPSQERDTHYSPV